MESSEPINTKCSNSCSHSFLVSLSICMLEQVKDEGDVFVELDEAQYADYVKDKRQSGADFVVDDGTRHSNSLRCFTRLQCNPTQQKMGFFLQKIVDILTTARKTGITRAKEAIRRKRRRQRIRPRVTNVLGPSSHFMIQPRFCKVAMLPRKGRSERHPRSRQRRSRSRRCSKVGAVSFVPFR